VALDVWLLLQATVSATAAWLVARYLFDHPTPYFAPIAAMIALTANLGERGLNAARVLQGVILGLLVGQLVLVTVGTGAGAMALGIFVAATTARAVWGPQVVVVQAAVSVILVVAVGDPANGVERLMDVLTGAGIALVFTQLLFPPEPLALLRRAEKATLTAIADGLAGTADAIAQDDDELAEQAVGKLRDVRDRLAQLRQAERASTNVTRRALVWRAHTTVVVRENENAEHLDLLCASCLMLARLIASAGSEPRRRLELPEVSFVRLPAKGRGRALKHTWSAFDARILAYMDVDLAALLPLVAPLITGHSGLAIGSRLSQGSRVTRGPKREIISRCYNLPLRHLEEYGFAGDRALRRRALAHRGQERAPRDAHRLGAGRPRRPS
jgi:uncharacterized membrane protein YgaE (UPF0421/DUF939 family)